MAAPTVRTSTTSATASDQTNHTVNMPATVSAGDTLGSLFACNGKVTITWPAGWNRIWTLDGTSGRCQFAWKKAAGTEGGGTITVTTASGEESGHVTLAIQGAADPTVTAPVASAGATAASANPNPDSLTPAGGAKDFLFIAVCGTLYASVSGYPSNCPDNRNTGSSGTASSDATSGLATYAASAAASFDPATFTISRATTYWTAATIAVYPAAAPPAGGRQMGVAKAYGKAWFATYRREPSGLYAKQRKLWTSELGRVG